MEFIKIKFIQAMIIGSLLFAGNTMAYAEIAEPCFQHINLSTADGFIVMEDDVMLVDANDSNDIILRIEIYSSEGEKVRDITGSFTSQCSVDLSDLLPGRYLVNVSTVNKSFSDFVDVE